MVPPSELKSWTRTCAAQEYLCTTNSELIQLDTLNAALGSDLLWWARSVPETELRKMVDHSLCLGLYIVEGPSRTDNNSSPPMVGFARVITDYVSFAYLTDVYVLPEHQGRGLGKWMMRCLDEILQGWPELRRFLLLTGDPAAVRLYETTLGMEVAQPGKLSFMQRAGPAAPDHHH